MPNLQHIVGANDNSPAWIMDAQRRQPITNAFVSAKKTKHLAKGPIVLTGIFPVAVFLTLASMLYFGVTTETFTTTAGLLGFCGLVWTAYCGKSQAWRSREFTVLSVIGSFVLAALGVAKIGNIALNSVDLAVLTGWVAFGLGWVFKSRSAALISILASATWFFAEIPSLNTLFGLGDVNSAGWVTTLPFLALGQILLSSQLQSKLCLTLSIMLSYGWAFWLGLMSGYPLTALAGLGFAIGVTHHRFGKSLSDEKRFGANLHNLLGAITALFAAYYMQSVWLDPAMNIGVPGWMPTQAWWFILAGASTTLFVTSLLRFKRSRITLSGIFILSIATLVLPFASIRPDLVREAFLSIPGLSAAPGFGLVIGAAIMAAGLAWVANGLRKLKLTNLIIGAALVGLQMVILFAPGRATIDMGIVFVCSLIAALCIGGLVAGAALDHTQPARRLT